MSITEPDVTRHVDPGILLSSECRRVLDALTRHGADVRFVGGCVRDLLLDHAIGDVDIGTPDSPDRVTELLERQDITVIQTGLSHGTVTAVIDGSSFEITTLRVDKLTHGRHATVEFTDDWKVDASRRDFTINAMSLRPDGAFFDYFGGHGDLTNGIVRFVGDAATRVSEDYLRILRFFRFYGRYGRGEPDHDAITACEHGKDQLSILSAERVCSELMGILGIANPLPSIALMKRTGLLAEILPEAANLDALTVLSGLDDRDPLRRLAALVPNAGAAVGYRLRLSNSQTRRLDKLSPPVVELDQALSLTEQRQLLYRHGVETFRDLVLLAWASQPGTGPRRWRCMLDSALKWENPALPVGGQDVLDLGVREGPEVGRLVRAVEAWWIGQDFQPDRAACLSQLRKEIGLA